MSLMKWATIVSKSEDSAEQTTDSSNNDLSSNKESNPVELDVSIMTISPIHSPASFTSDTCCDKGTDIYSMTSDMYDTALQLFYLDDEDTMEVTKNESPLPFQKLSADWYRRQNKKFNRNASRERTRQCNPGQFGIDGKIKYVNRSWVDGSLNDNIKELEGRASSANFHIRAVIAVGRFIAFHGPIVKTQMH